MSYDFEKLSDQANWLEELRRVMAKNPNAEFNITADDSLWLAIGPRVHEEVVICGDNARIVQILDRTIDALRARADADMMANG